MIPTLSVAYSRAALWRRRWYARDSARRRYLQSPVVSVGNLRVGGSGKTPIVAYVARLLVEAGEKPSILTRGYARIATSAGTTVVSDGTTIVPTVETAGDEALLLARALRGVPVLVGADRHVSGRLAERRFGTSVHILDDGFQHVQLARSVDLLLVSDDDLAEIPLPAGRLREPLDAARNADAVLVTAGYATAADRVRRILGVPRAFRVTRTLGAPRTLGNSDETVVVPAGSRVFLVAGIARPERFVADATSAGWEVVGTMMFRDHHQFTDADVRRMAAAARAAASAIILTTEKDAMRLETCNFAGLRIASVPLIVGIDPADDFREWLLSSLKTHRDGGGSSGRRPRSAEEHTAADTQHAE